MAPTPKCPHCDADWPDGPAIRDEGGEIRLVYCPDCGRVVAVLPVVQYVASA